MNKAKFSLMLGLLLFLPTLSFSQEITRPDETAIRQVVQYYYDGIKNHDGSILRKAFHPKAKWLARTNENNLIEFPIAQYYANIRRNARGARPTNVNMRIVSIDLMGKTALVKAEFIYPDGIIDVPPAGVKQTEYLSFIKFDEGWRIVNKVFSFEKLSSASQSKMQLRVSRKTS
jgi:putative lumazine-binding protein